MQGRRQFLGALLGVIPASALGQTAGASKKAPSNTKSTVRAKPKMRTSTVPVRPLGPDVPAVSDAQIERVLAPVRDKHHLPGIVGGVVRGDRLGEVGALGIRKIGSTEPFTVNDRVHLGSCTKAMTATLAGMAVDAGKLRWDSTLASVFPDQAGQMHADFRKVTLWNLLTHRAGLPHDAPWWQLGRRGSNATDQRRAIIPMMLAQAPASKPGTRFAYSNVGYALAGLMLEQVSNQSWETLMKERLFDPLGMKSAGFGVPGQGQKVDEPWGHHGNGDVRPVRADNAPSMGPAGNVHCTMGDWAKFVGLHLRGAQGDARLLKLSSFQRLQTPPNGGEYGGGWYVLERSWAGGLALNHNGSNTTWYATVWIAPVRDFAVLVATNQGSGNVASACEEATIALLQYIDFHGAGPGNRRR